MAIKRFDDGDAVDEKSDAEYECTFIDAAGGALNAAAITAITATLKDVPTDAVINSRDAQNVRNINGGTLAADGKFTLQLGELDNILVGTPPAADVFESGWKRTGEALEEHRLTLRVTYTKAGGGTGKLNHEVRFFVQSLEDVP
jgi:hypothetical protein